MESRYFAINMAFIIFIVLSILVFKVKILKHIKYILRLFLAFVEYRNLMKLSLCSKPHIFEVQKLTM